ncbi:hypothetical protein BZL43_26030 [Pseudomonas sp. PICF141]|nr:hypothetical protein BZL43_26030 [Pseudomonas sp. PICF141]
MGAGPWRGGSPPFECVALTKSLVHQRFGGCFAAQRGRAPSPQTRSHIGFVLLSEDQLSANAIRSRATGAFTASSNCMQRSRNRYM